MHCNPNIYPHLVCRRMEEAKYCLITAPTPPIPISNWYWLLKIHISAVSRKYDLFRKKKGSCVLKQNEQMKSLTFRVKCWACLNLHRALKCKLYLDMLLTYTCTQTRKMCVFQRWLIFKYTERFLNMEFIPITQSSGRTLLELLLPQAEFDFGEPGRITVKCFSENTCKACLLQILVHLFQLF